MTVLLSIIIPVWNEAQTINATLSHLESLTSEGELEIIVVDADPGGATIHAITRSDAQKIIGTRGRGAQLNRGAVAASGKTLLFLHADTILPDDGLTAIVPCMEDPDISGGAFDLGIGSGKIAFRLIEAMVYLRTRLTHIPYGDQAIFLRSDVFHSIGGYREMALMEDVELMGRVKRAGHRITIIPTKVRTSARRWEKEGILRCTLRNWSLMALYLMGVSPERLANYYR
ncbi:MAG: TIGR04283 family arsenosugar biosynthesis glycosyltransferase [Desulfobacterales bacterium]